MAAVHNYTELTLEEVQAQDEDEARARMQSEFSAMVGVPIPPQRTWRLHRHTPKNLQTGPPVDRRRREGFGLGFVLGRTQPLQGGHCDSRDGEDHRELVPGEGGFTPSIQLSSARPTLLPLQLSPLLRHGLGSPLPPKQGLRPPASPSQLASQMGPADSDRCQQPCTASAALHRRPLPSAPAPSPPIPLRERSAARVAKRPIDGFHLWGPDGPAPGHYITDFEIENLSIFEVLDSQGQPTVQLRLTAFERLDNATEQMMMYRRKRHGGVRGGYQRLGRDWQ
ncbi:hypothetical protein BDK51DRAFT_45234 [Blyttiomyces helicus]|uniref:Uncharacterized protein n=1 Tax=Blyttiomyces helicus TaxID=388810 RepID=A0A4P9WL00_9FUNG|nr:hypothetical protein BDK51DRAFT_45234 [Blyttiomyces helicus]|eukprot:RKO91860.1 hypothetical protein BDK51DRAFT_45234 [Blyttiomyces helicus]